jgi:hypothetical protein
MKERLRLPYWLVPQGRSEMVFRPRFLGYCRHGEDRSVNVCPSCDGPPWERASRAIRRATRRATRPYYVALLVPKRLWKWAGCKAWARSWPRVFVPVATLWNEVVVRWT